MEQPQQLKQATISTQFRDIMILHLDHLSILYRDLLRAYAKSALDEEIYNNCISEIIVVLDFIYPKLKGGGTKTESLLKELENYVAWTDNIMIPKLDKTERKKLHKLYKLVQDAYDILGLSNY